MFVGFGTRRDQIKRVMCFSIWCQVLGQEPFCGAELRVCRHAAAVFAGKCTRQRDRFPFHGEIKVIQRATQQEVPHRTANNIKRQTLFELLHPERNEAEPDCAASRDVSSR